MSQTDKAFRKLCKDDIYQTTEQWRERALRRLGEVSGKWATWAEQDSIPQMPARRPIEPVKPSTEELLLPIKQHLQRVHLEVQRLTNPNAKLEDIPMPTAQASTVSKRNFQKFLLCLLLLLLYQPPIVAMPD